MSEASKQTTKTTSAGWRIVFAGIAWAAVVAGALVVMSMTGYKPEGPDSWTYDWRTYLFSQTAKTPRKDIAVILITEDTLAEYDYLSPTDRGLMATLVRAIDAAKPKAIGLDFFYDRKSEAAKTADLIEAIKNAQAPVVVGAIDRRFNVKPENFQYQDNFIKSANAQAGQVFLGRELERMKLDEQVIRYIGAGLSDSPYSKSFAATVAGVNGPKAEPMNRHIAWLLSSAGSDLFPTFRIPRHMPGADMDAILKPSWRTALKDKYVLVGVDMPGQDRHITPLSIWNGRKMPGVLIQAQILAQYLDGRSLYTIPWRAELIILMLTAFFGFLVSSQWDSKRLDWVFYVSGLVVLGIAGGVLFSVYAVILPTTLLLLAWTAGVTGAHYSKGVLRRIRVVAQKVPLVHRHAKDAPEAITLEATAENTGKGKGDGGNAMPDNIAT
ncbi:MAG: CHASE2 domain-containing protein [Alphaproteobacteria bacterium]